MAVEVDLIIQATQLRDGLQGLVGEERLDASAIKNIPSGGGDVPFVLPEEYGAIGDGITDDSVAIQTAINTGNPVYFSKKTYLVNTTINIPNNSQILGSGYSSIIKTTTNITIFDITGFNIEINSLSFLGTKTGAIQRGISAIGVTGFDDHYNIKINQCNFVSLTNGVYATNNIGVNYEGVFYIVNSFFFNNTVGFFADVRGEYNTLNNCVFKSNNTGVYFNGGNNSIIGGQIVNGTNGIYLGTGANDGHGVASAVKINHNANNISANNVSFNYLFSSCMFYAGKIYISASNGIRLKSCEFGTWSLEIINSDNIILSDNFYQTNPTTIILTNNSNLINRGGLFKSGIIPNELKNIDELKDSQGTVIKFDSYRKYGFSSVESQNISYDFDFALDGVEQILKHKSAVEPSFQEPTIIRGDAFVPDVDNYYYLRSINVNDVWTVLVDRKIYNNQPISLPAIWYDASDASSIDTDVNDNVLSIANKGTIANGEMIFTSGEATYIPNGINNLNVVRGLGAGMTFSMSNANKADYKFLHNINRVIYQVFRIAENTDKLMSLFSNSITTANIGLLSSYENRTGQPLNSYFGFINGQGSTAISQRTDAETFVKTVVQCVIIRNDSLTGYIYNKNNLLKSNPLILNNLSPANSANVLTIGGLGFPVIGDLCEIRAYNVDHDLDTREAITNELVNKWGVI